MSSLCEVQVANSMGIELLDRGKLKKAIEGFTEAISQLSWCILLPTPFAADTAKNKDKQDNDKKEEATKETNSSSSSSSSKKKKKTRQEESEFMDIYCFKEDIMDPTMDEFFMQGFHFEWSDDDDADSSSPTSEQHRAATVCCEFNLALCHHLEWQRRENKQARPLMMALRHYQEAFDSLNVYFRYKNKNINNNTTENRTTRLSPDDPIMKVFMALATNATHCQRELGNLEEAQRWNARLCHVLKFCEHSETNGNNDFFYGTAELNNLVALPPATPTRQRGGGGVTHTAQAA